MEPIAGYTRILEMLSSCLTKLIEAVKNIKSDPLKYTLLLGIVFQITVVFTHLVFSDIYLTTFISIGILFLGYMGYLTYNRDQERKSLDDQ
jgi:positive regulator of sigma E activity